MSSKAFNYFVMQHQRKKIETIGDGASKQFAQPGQLMPSNEGGDGGVGEGGALGGDNGEFRCKSCLRGPPLTKKYAKNQC